MHDSSIEKIKKGFYFWYKIYRLQTTLVNLVKSVFKPNYLTTRKEFWKLFQLIILNEEYFLKPADAWNTKKVRNR